MTPSEARRRKLKAQTPENLAKIDNALIEAFVAKNNIFALKILFYIAKMKIELDIKELELQTITLNVDNTLEYCKIDIRTLKRNIKQMTETSISFVDKKEDITEYISILPYAKIYKNNIEIKMFKKIIMLIAELKNKFTIIDLDNLMQLESKHSVRMVQLLEYIRGFSSSDTVAETDKKVSIPKRKRYLLEDLNGMFGVDYKRFADFERKILKPVKEELDDKSDLSFLYQLEEDKTVSQGRKKHIAVTIDLVDNIKRQRRFIF